MSDHLIEAALALPRMSSEWSSNDWMRFSDSQTVDVTPNCTVVVPAHGNQKRLNAVIRALSHQTYSRSHWELIVVDDGSDPPLEVRADVGVRCRILRQERDGFGAGRARHLGATHADRASSVLVFLDSDMLPEQDWLEAHLQVHARVPRALVCGFRRHVKQTIVEPEHVVAGTPIQDLFGKAGVVEPEWLLREWTRTSWGVAKSNRLWRVTSSGNLSVARDVYQDCGGFDGEAFDQWGGEDNDFGYRALQAGALVVPQQQAIAYHLGLGTTAEAGADRLLRRSRLQLGARLPPSEIQGLRHVVPVYPDSLVEYDLRQTDLEDVVRLVKAAAALPISDRLRTRFVVRKGSDVASLLVDVLSLDGRFSVVVADEKETTQTEFVPSRVLATAEAASIDPQLCVRLAGALKEGGTGVLSIVNDSGMVVYHGQLTRIANQVRTGLLTPSQAFNRYGGRVASLDEIPMGV